MSSIPRRCLRAFLLVLVGAAPTSADAQPFFVDEAVARGVNYSTPASSFPSAYGLGVGLVDLDGDGDLDAVLVGAANGTVGFFENSGGGSFVQRPAGPGVPAISVLSGIAAADYDADGDLDLYISNWAGPNLLLRNDGGFQFDNVAVFAGVADNGPGTGCCWGDVDGDGWLDLYVVNRTGQFGGTGGGTHLPNRLFRNLGNGTFAPMAVGTDVEDAYAGFQAVFFDYDRDGDVDLYLSNDRGTNVGSGNRLWRNDSGVLVNVSAGSGADVRIDSMGVAVGDLNADGFLDLYLTNTPAGNPLLLNQGNGSFVDFAFAAGVSAHWTGWGTHFMDFDNDGWQELYVANFYQRNYLYDCDGTFPCVELGTATGFVGFEGTLCTAIGDVDGDGDLDLLEQNFMQPTRLFMNHVGQGSHCLLVRLRDGPPNTHAVGAIVDVRVGARTQTQSVVVSSGFKTTSSYDLHFGLGTDVVADSVTVTWPGGEAQRWIDVGADQVLVLDRTATYLDCDGNGTDDSIDIASGVHIDVNGNGVPDPCDPAFVRGDADLSGTIQLSDAIVMLGYLFQGKLSVCRDALDATDDGSVNLADAVTLLLYLFASGPLGPAPGVCALDMTPDGLSCNGTLGPCP